MIEINLLPTGKKKKERRVPAISSKAIMYACVGLAALLVSIHLLLGALVLIKKGQLNNLNNQWPQFEADKTKLDTLRKDLSALESNVRTIEKLTTKRISWSKKLELLSDIIPSGIWLTDLSITSERFILQGSAVSKKSEEMALIGKYLNELKSKPEFIKNITNLELGPAQRKLVKGWEIVDFIFTGNILGSSKGKE